MSTTIVFFHIWPPLESVMGFLNLLVFFSWNYMSLTNFLQATRFGGGFVKLGWKPEDPSLHKKLQYCPLCEGYKAPRSHHCARCNRCVLKMDHHCRKLTLISILKYLKLYYNIYLYVYMYIIIYIEPIY